MDSQILTDMLLSNEVIYPCYGGVIACDSLQTYKINRDKYYIINTETKNSHIVGHWIVLYFYFGKCDFFDPLANNINYYNNLIYKFMNNNCSFKFSYSTVKIQASNSDKCGQFCMLFCYARCNKETFKDILAYFETENISENDLIVRNFYNGLVKHKNLFMCCGENYMWRTVYIEGDECFI